MLGKQDWSRFVPSVIAALIVAIILAAARAYRLSERFRSLTQHLWNRLWRWLVAHGQVIVGVSVFLAIAASFALAQALGLGLMQSLLSVVLVLFLTLANFLPPVWHSHPSERRRLGPEWQEIRATTSDLQRELGHFNYSEQTEVEMSAGRPIIHAWTDLRSKCDTWELVVGGRLTGDEKARARGVCRTMEQAPDIRSFQPQVSLLKGYIIELSHIALARIQ